MSNKKGVLKTVTWALTWAQFLELVRARLLLKRGDWLAFAAETGLTYRWIRTFAHAEKVDATPSRVIQAAEALGIRFRVSVAQDKPVRPPTGRV